MTCRDRHVALASRVMDPAVAESLATAYQTPTRRYHTFAHAAAVAAHATALGGSRAALLAAWFHDAVYDATATDNEERSARLLQSWLKGEPDAAEAARLVRLTARHTADPGDADGAILCDADLAILGTDRAAYATYRRAVRQEYGHLDDDQWRVGRTAVLQGLLHRPWIFSTEEGRRRWEAAARRNLTAELAELTGERSSADDDAADPQR